MFANAEAYERFMGRWSQLLVPPLLDFADVPDDSRVLDLGSGTGSLTLAIAALRRHAKVVGVDPSANYVAYANTRSPRSSVHFELGDAQELRFARGEFDFAFSLLVFNLIPDPGRALAELRRVTRPGGTICAAVWDYSAGMAMLKLFWDAAVALDSSADPFHEKHMPLCREGELLRLWNVAGLADTRQQAVQITMTFQSFADYWGPFLAGQGPAGAYVQRIEPEARIALEQRVRTLLPQAARSGSFQLPARAWAVRGTNPA